MNLPAFDNPNHQHVFDAMNNASGQYFTKPGLSHQTGLPLNTINDAFSAHPGLVRRSVIPTTDPLYTLNTPLSAFKDQVNAIRGMQFDKY